MTTIPSLPKVLEPMKNFYVWYTELCRRKNQHPLLTVDKAKPDSAVILEFVAAKMKTEDWWPILGALKNDTSLYVISIHADGKEKKFLWEVKSDDALRRMKRRLDCLWTHHMFTLFLKAVGSALKNSQVNCVILTKSSLSVSLHFTKPTMQQ